jgi:hypothetical protein
MAFQKREGHIKVPAEHIENGVRLDAWVTRQRQHFRMGRIQRQGDHVTRLERVPGWKWSESYAERWDRHYTALVKFVEREGHASVPTKHVEGDAMLGQWVSNQLQRYRWLQAHHPLRIARLEALPGWTWSRVSARVAGRADRKRGQPTYEGSPRLVVARPSSPEAPRRSACRS